LAASARKMADTRRLGPDLDEVIKLFTGPNSASIYERHYASIERLCKANTDGFALADLPKVQEVLELSFQLLRSGISGFLEPVCSLLRALAKPFIKKAATDEVRLLRNVESLLRVLGIVFAPGYQVELQLAVCETLQEFANAHGQRPGALELDSTPADAVAGSRLHKYLTNNKLLVQSHVTSAVIRGLAIAISGNNQVLMLNLSLTLLSFSYLPTNCRQLVQLGALSCMPALLSFGYKHDLTGIAIELLWNMLERAAEAKQQLLMPQPSLLSLETTNSGTAVPGNVPNVTNSEDVQALTGRESVALDAEAEEPCAQNADSEAGQHERDAAYLPCVSKQEASGVIMVDGELAHVLTRLFRTVLVDGNRAQDKELRNNVLVVISFVVDASPEFVATCHSAGLFDAVLAIACAPEVCDGSPHVKPWALSTDEIDLELKMLCCNVACTGAVMLPDVLEAAKAAGFMSMLLQHLDDINTSPAVVRWNADRCSSLRSTALSALQRLAPLAVDLYLSLGGVPVLLSMLANCTVPVHVEAGLCHLNMLVAAAPEMAEVLGTEGAMPLLLDIVQCAVAIWPEGLRQAALQLLALMCSVNAENRRRLRKSQGLEVLVGQLANAAALDPTLPSQLALATLDAVWSGIVPDRKNVARFLVADGMDLLLSFLETGNRGHRATALCVLADLLENPRSHPFFHDWRSSRNKQTAAHLLVNIWKEEDVLRGMTVEGVLSNTSQPLRGLDKRLRWVPPESVAYGNLTAERKAQLSAIMEACPGEKMLAKVFMVG